MVLVYFLIFLLGLAIGSFLNVCIHRLPISKSIIFPPSHCTYCKKSLKSIDLVPLISYLFLHGHCRYCKTKISIRYPFIELLTALLFIWCFFLIAPSSKVIEVLCLIPFLIVITFIDYDHQLILDKVLIWLAGVGIVINLITTDISLINMLTAAVIGGGIMLIIAIISRGGMGGGDIKFAAALGLWLGVKLTLLTIFISFILGGLCGMFVLIFRLKNRKDFIPFGPFIAISAFISLLYGNAIIDWYIARFL